MCFSGRIKWIALVAAAVVSAGLIVRFCTPCATCALVLSGRSEPCTLAQALESMRQEELRLSESRPRKLRLLERDSAGLHLWEVDGEKVWTPPGGERFLSRGSRTRYRTLDTSGEVLIRPGDVVLDCGGYIGDSAREALALGARQVISVEPSPRNLACLRRNLKKEIAEGRVIVYPKGVWDGEESLPLEENDANPAADHVQERGEGDKVIALTTIDRIVEELGLDRLDLIKMDIEGAEQRALRGAARTIARYRPRLIIAAYHQRDDRERIPELVRSARPDYQMEWGRCLRDGWRISPAVYYFH